MSNGEHYHSEDRRDILGDRGHRYKRNTLGLSAAAIVVAVLPGVTIDTAALPGVINVGPLSFWILYTGVLVYNSGLWLHHVNQDWLLFQSDFEKVHIGHRKTLETGDEEEFEPPKNTGYKRSRAIRTMPKQGLHIEVQHKASETAGWNHGHGGKLISVTDLLHVQRKERHFLWWELRIPLALCVGAFAGITLQAFNASTAPASGITITDGESIKIDG